LDNLSVNQLTCPSRPTNTRLLKSILTPLSFTIYPLIAPENFTPFFFDSVSRPHLQLSLLTLFFLGIFTVMAQKSKQAEGEENPFLPPPVDLDRIPLADKDHLIADKKCDFDFADLQS
jgi:hypothetical protein